MDYNLKIYLEQSEDGKRMKELFSFTSEETEDCFLEKMKTIYELSKENLNVIDFGYFIDFYFDLIEGADNVLGEEEISDNDFFYAIMEDFKQNDVPARNRPTLIPYLSLALYNLTEDSSFYPILYNHNFNTLLDSCKLLGIEVPTELPLQKDIEERCDLYMTICNALEEFRKENNLSKEDVCALLYGYARECLSNTELDTTSLPTPSRIWFAGASKSDYDTTLKQDTSVWQCNANTQRGDIVVVYALSPYSHIHSVWKAIQDASFNPFDMYCDRIKVGYRIEVPHITSKELKVDASMQNMPIVRKNLQGLNGVELSIEDYRNLQRMFEEKGFDNSALPQIVSPEINLNVDIELEKDVEEQLLIPVLEQLGYVTSDWQRQLTIKLGRKEKLIPDFVFFPQVISSRQIKAPFMIEAKLDFKNPRQLRKDFDQAVSYARPLEAALTGICDKHQLRIYKKGPDGLFTENTIVFHDYWENLQDANIFNELKKLIGKYVVEKLK